MSPARDFERAGACDDCGHSVGGLIAVPAGVDPTVLCESCAGVDPGYGTFVRDRVSGDDERWYPGEGDSPRMCP